MISNDEISLAEIVLIFIKRRYYFLIAFIASLLLSVTFIYKFENDDTKISVYRVSLINNQRLTPPEILIASLQNDFFYEEIINSDKFNQLWRKTKLSNPKSSNVIRIETQYKNLESVEEFHNKLMNYLAMIDKEHYESTFRKFHNELSTLGDLLTLSLGVEKKEKVKEEIENLKLKIQSGKPGEVLLQNGSKKLIEGNKIKKKVAVGLVLSLFFSLFFVVMVEVCASVRKEINILQTNKQKDIENE